MGPGGFLGEMIGCMSRFCNDWPFCHRFDLMMEKEFQCTKQGPKLPETSRPFAIEDVKMFRCTGARASFVQRKASEMEGDDTFHIPVANT